MKKDYEACKGELCTSKEKRKSKKFQEGRFMTCESDGDIFTLIKHHTAVVPLKLCQRSSFKNSIFTYTTQSDKVLFSYLLLKSCFLFKSTDYLWKSTQLLSCQKWTAVRRKHYVNTGTLTLVPVEGTIEMNYGSACSLCFWWWAAAVFTSTARCFLWFNEHRCHFRADVNVHLRAKSGISPNGDNR